jgi:hypothetical protein
MTRPKDIGTRAESAVVKFLRENGFPHAERRALTGSQDQGDITGCPGLVFEVKGGEAAKNASDGQVEKWLAETEIERNNANADIGVLVVQRRGIGAPNAGRWWAVIRRNGTAFGDPHFQFAVRYLLSDAVHLIRAAGYGDPIEKESAA